MSVYFYLKLIFNVECQTTIALWGKISEQALFWRVLSYMTEQSLFSHYAVSGFKRAQVTKSSAACPVLNVSLFYWSFKHSKNIHDPLWTELNMCLTAWDVARPTNSPSEEICWTVIVFIIRVFELSFSTSGANKISWNMQ